jgi:outer membrane protein insertion porin family
MACTALLIGAAAAAHAFDPFTVRDIRVEGIQRIEAGTVFSYLPVKVGDTMTEAKASEAIRALFTTGFFRDVRLEVEGSVLVVIVEERPAVANIDFEGMKEFKSEDVKKALRDAGLSEGKIFDRAMLEQAEQELKRQYLTHGFYAMTVTTTVTPLERNRVGVNFNVDEGPVAKIHAINIVGNHVFAEKDLLAVLSLQPPNWISWYTKNDQYSRQKLTADLDTLKSFYQNRGYLDFNIDSTQVSITPDKKDIYITVNISEGEKYTISDIKFGGELLLSEPELRSLLQVKVGQEFDREKMVASTKAITERLGRDGYAFANANAIPDINKEARTAAFTIMIDPGRRVYVRRINVSGNTKTRDEVIRREMRQLEGAFYDSSKIQNSKTRLERTNYFNDVEVDSPPVPGTSDQVDVDVRVKEKSTGALLFGLGFSQAAKVIVSTSVSQSNFLGSGKTIGAALNTSAINTNLGLSYTDPFYTVDGVSQGFDVYLRKSNPASIGLGDYQTTTGGVGVRYGYPVSDITRIDGGLTLEVDKVETFADSPNQILNFVADSGNSYTNLAPTGSFTTDTRDSARWTTSGRLERATAEVSIPPGKLRLWRMDYRNSWYYPLNPDLTLMLNGEIGAANGYGGHVLPFFKNFYAGGPDSVRGYDTSSLGPVDIDGSTRLGGNRLLVGNVEFMFPMPGAGKDRSVRLSTFLDGGQVYGSDQKLDFSELRFSAGVALAWNSPFGPMKFNLAHPINPKPGDNKQVFQFNLGQIF